MNPKKLKQDRINAIIDKAAKDLKAEGVRFFIGVVDRQPKEPNGGTAYAQSDISAIDMQCILDMAMPTRQDLISLGIWLGNRITALKRKKG
jgi:hypothetical protein